MMLVLPFFFRLGQHALQVGVDDEWKALFPVVVVEREPLVVLARQPDSALVYLAAICYV